MGKALKTAGMIIGGAVLIATGVGAVAGLQVTALGLSGLGTLSVGTLNTLSAGLTAVGTMLDKPKSAGAASPTEWTSNPDQPIPFAFGLVGVAGKIVHRDEFGTDNFRQGIVSVYSGAGPIRSFVSYRADQLPITFMGDAALGKYAGQMWRRTSLGAQPSGALSGAMGSGGSLPGWGPDHRLSGKACDLLILQQDSKFSVYPSGEPRPLCELEGVFGYDPRYDSTYPGGLGACRYADRSTWRWIDNPIIAALNWALGMRENGVVVGGIGASRDGIDLPAYAEAATIADLNGWKVTAWPDTSEDAFAVLKQLLQAGGAKYARRGGKVSCVSRGAPRSSIVTITAKDTAGPIELDASPSIFDRINTLTPSFMSQAHGWEIVPADPVSFPELVEEDGGQRSDAVELRFVPLLKQAAELAAYDILDAREPFSGVVPLKPHMRQLEAGDCFDIDEPGFLLHGVKCLVLSRGYDTKTGEVRLSFRSETDAKHALALGKATTVPAYPELSPADPDAITAPSSDDWTLTSEVFVKGGAPVPTLVVTGVTGNPQTEAVYFEKRAVTDPPSPWSSVSIEGPTVVRKDITGLTNLTPYEVGIRYRVAGRMSERLVLGPVTSGSSLPLNGTIGAGVTLNPPAPLSPGDPASSVIEVAALSATLLGGEVLTFPSATILGLTPDTYYAVFRDLEAGAYVAIATGLTPYFSSVSRYLFVGYQSTALEGGGYSPPEDPLPGGGGGYCPAPETLVLLANAERDGPGEEVTASEVVPLRDWVWTRHEQTLEWGAFRVLAANRHEDQARLTLELTDGRSMTAAVTHRLIGPETGWADLVALAPGAALIGRQTGFVAGVREAERGPVISFVIEEAHTLITEGLLSHNIKSKPYADPYYV